MSDLVRDFVLAKSYQKAETGVFVEITDRPPVVSVKRLVGAPLTPLPERLLPLPALDAAFAQLKGEQSLPRPDAPLLDRLGTLLFYNLGLLRRECAHKYNNHRAVPSPRCFYPSELYVWLPEGQSLPSGLYHYVAPEHGLELVRLGGREWLESALQTDLDRAEAVLLIGVEFWRVTHQYGDFGYRLCHLEAGHLAGNLLLMAGPLGWKAQLRYQFRDQELQALIGLSAAEESVVGAVILGEGIGPVGRERPAPAELSPLQGEWRSSQGNGATQQTAWLRAVDAATQLGSSGPTGTVASGSVGAPSRITTATSISLHDVPAPAPIPLQDAYWHRNSGYGPFGLCPLPVSLPLSKVAAALANALPRYNSDLSADGQARPFIELHTAAVRVQDLAPGVYRYRPEGHALEGTQSGSPGSALQALYMYQDAVNLQTHGLVWFMTADPNAAITRWGDRGYRILNMEAGLISQFLSLSMAGDGHYARSSCSFDEYLTDRLLQTTLTPQMPVYQVLVGTNRFRGWQLDLRP